MDELLEQFLIEGPEQIADGVEALLALESAPQDGAALDRAFRAVHTLKGSAGLFDLPAMAATLHAAEDVLAELRGGRRRIERRLIDALMAALGRCETWMLELAAGGAAASLAQADDVLSALAARPETARLAPNTPEPAAPDWARAFAARAAPGAARVTVVHCRPDPQAFYRGEDPLALAAATPGLVRLELEPGDVALGEGYDPYLCAMGFRLASTADPDTVRSVFRPALGQFELYETTSAGPGAARAAPRVQRVDQSRIDALIATSQDLAASGAALGALSARLEAAGVSEAGAVAAQSAALTRAIGRLHEEVMALRMAPLGPLLRRYRRLARELSGELGKPVDVAVDDGGLEADRDIIEGLADPLTHLVRNAMSHGVEGPSERASAGKPAMGRLQLIARRSGPRLVIRVVDDGGGLNLDAIRRKALEQALVSEQALMAMSDEDVANLVFLPGFSTAQGVSSVSGRGVGMDAVRTAMAGLGGEVRLHSRPGHGAEAVLTVPFRMAMSKIVIVRAGAERFGVLLDQILETVLLAPGAVHPIGAGFAIDWRGRATPVCSLAELAEVAAPPALIEARRALLVQGLDGPAAVTVDQVLERRDVVLRPLGGLLAQTPGVAGTTTLQDGALLLVLDLEALVR